MISCWISEVPSKIVKNLIEDDKAEPPTTQKGSGDDDRKHS